MTATIETSRPTDHFTGRCPSCREPVRVHRPGTHGDRRNIHCPVCGHGNVQVERIYGVRSRDTCDSRCMSAIGPNCNCGCGGSNHGKSWGVARYAELTASELHARQEALARLQAQEDKARIRREQAAERKRRAAAAEVAAWRARLTADEHTAITRLLDGSIDITGSGFLLDMRDQLAAARPRPLSPRQLAATVKQVTRQHEWERAAAEREARRAQDAADATPVPTGRHTITGEIVHTESRESRYGYNRFDYKMILRGEGGWKVWVTIPNSLFTEVEYHIKRLRGRRVEMTVTIEPGDRDPSFGFGKSPKNARLLPA